MISSVHGLLIVDAQIQTNIRYNNAYNETCKLSSNHVYFTRQQDENEICRRGQTPNPRGVTIWARSYLLLFPFFQLETNSICNICICRVGLHILFKFISENN